MNKKITKCLRGLRQVVVPGDFSEAINRNSSYVKARELLEKLPKTQRISKYTAGRDPLLLSVSGLGLCGLHRTGENAQMAFFSFAGPYGHEPQFAWHCELCDLQPLGPSSGRPLSCWKLPIQLALSVITTLRLPCSGEHPAPAQFTSAGLCPIIT